MSVSQMFFNQNKWSLVLWLKIFGQLTVGWTMFWSVHLWHIGPYSNTLIYGTISKSFSLASLSNLVKCINLAQWAYLRVQVKLNCFEYDLWAPPYSAVYTLCNDQMSFRPNVFNQKTRLHFFRSKTILPTDVWSTPCFAHLRFCNMVSSWLKVKSIYTSYMPVGQLIFD